MSPLSQTVILCFYFINLFVHFSELFTTVLDMLATLIHSTLIPDNHSERDENKKLYINLIKKLRKELGERRNPSLKLVRQLLPLIKIPVEIITCDPVGTYIDTKGNKVIGFDISDRTPGLNPTDKQRVNVWEMIESQKNPAPLSWAWFTGVKMQRKTLKYEEEHRLMRFHTHNMTKAKSYYYQPIRATPYRYLAERHYVSLFHFFCR